MAGFQWGRGPSLPSALWNIIEQTVGQAFALGMEGKAALTITFQDPVGVGCCARRGHLTSSDP